MVSMLKKILNWPKETETAKTGGEHGNISFSQCGEDLIIKYMAKLRFLSIPSYLDIGAFNPWYLSNTALFYKEGSRGINIEANPQLIHKFIKERPDDINLNIGVGIKDGSMPFYIFEDTTLSTFSETEATTAQADYGHKLAATIMVQVHSINNIVEEYCSGKWPDILTIDVEGIDFEVMQDADFSNSKPKIICAETAEYSPIGAGKKRDEYIRLIQDKGYYLYADTNLNSIFVENDFWFI
jgi:FkbM family methyltransferase